jgi:hypothetical protein
MVYCTLFNGTVGLPNENFSHAVAIYYISKLSDILPDALDALGFADFENKYQDLLGLLQFFRSDTIAKLSADLKSFIPQQALIELCEEILFGCKLDSIRAVHDECMRRIGELRKRQFLSSFLAQHPGIQHKAGVPLGGTFIVVYHKDPEPIGQTDGFKLNVAAERTAQLAKEAVARVGPRPAEAAFAEAAHAADRATMSALRSTLGAGKDANAALIDAIGRISSNRVLAVNPDIGLLIGSLTGKVPIFAGDRPLGGLDDASSKIIAATVNGLADGSVIADFFLPYRVSCDCPGIQFVLPKQAPTFTTKVGCTNADGFAAVTVEAKGGVAPYDISIDKAAYQALNGPLQLPAGGHSVTLRDADGTESAARTVTVPGPIVIGAPTYSCTEGKFTASATIIGGTAPYTVNGKAIDGAAFTTDPAESGSEVPVEVVDSNGCTASGSFKHVCPPLCTLPCAGIALRRGYRFWIPDVDPNNPYKSFKLSNLVFSVEAAPGKPVDLGGQIKPILVAKPAELAPAAFSKLVNSWIDQINKVIAGEPLLNEAGKAQWLTLAYEATGPGRLGVLWIEYFECLKFDIQIASAVVRTGRTENARVAYLPEATTIQAGDSVTTVPAFAGTRTDKCSQEPKPEPLCPKELDFVLKITQDVTGGNTVLLSVEPVPATTDLTFVWEVQDGTPPMGNGPSFTTVTASTGRKLVTVTAFTKDGCIVTQSTEVNVG